MSRYSYNNIASEASKVYAKNQRSVAIQPEYICILWTFLTIIFGGAKIQILELNLHTVWQFSNTKRFVDTYKMYM